MSNLAAYVAGGLAVALTMDVVAPPVGAGIIRSGLTVSPASFNARFDAAAPASLYEVNRIGKGSRLAPPQAGMEPPFCCDPAYSTLVRVAPVNFIGRCVV